MEPKKVALGQFEDFCSQTRHLFWPFLLFSLRQADLIAIHTFFISSLLCDASRHVARDGVTNFVSRFRRATGTRGAGHAPPALREDPPPDGLLFLSALRQGKPVSPRDILGEVGRTMRSGGQRVGSEWKSGARACAGCPGRSPSRWFSGAWGAVVHCASAHTSGRHGGGAGECVHEAR